MHIRKLLLLPTLIFGLLVQTPTLAATGEYEVIVIGGGVSGLATVESLAKSGIHDVLLLEQSERVGGKMWTERERGAGAVYYERGAELVNSSDIELIDLIGSLGLGLTERRFKRELRNEVLMFRERTLGPQGQVQEGRLKAFSFEELVEKMHEFPQDLKVLEHLNRLQSSRAMQDSPELRSTPARALVENGVYTKQLFEAIMQSEFGVSLRQVNAEVLLDYVKMAVIQNPDGTKRFKIEIIPSADEKFRISGGTDTVTSALAKRHTEKIRLNAKVDSVEQLSRSEFRVGVNGQTLKARHVVFAVPAADLGRMRITSPDISAESLRKAAALPFGHNAKIFLIFKEKFWNGNFSRDTRAFGGVGILESGVQFWDTTENQERSGRGVLTLYPGAWPTEQDAHNRKLKEVLNDLRKVPGLEALDQHLVKIDVQNWQRSYAGVFNTDYVAAPKLFAEKLPANIYFVGADKDNDLKGQISESYGYMNGAVRTAIHASRRIIEKMVRLRAASGKMSCRKLILNAG